MGILFDSLSLSLCSEGDETYLRDSPLQHKVLPSTNFFLLARTLFYLVYSWTGDSYLSSFWPFHFWHSSGAGGRLQESSKLRGMHHLDLTFRMSPDWFFLGNSLARKGSSGRKSKCLGLIQLHHT